ncbi:MAG: glycosyltransferase family 4 protein [bacterium]
MKNRILVIEGQRNIGGGQVMTKKIATALTERYKVKIFLPSGQSPIADYLNQFNQWGYHFFSYNRGKKSLKDIIKFIINFFSSYSALRKCVREFTPNVIYVQSSALLPIAALIGQRYNISVVSHLHVVHSDNKSKFILNKFLSFSSVKRIIGVSNYTLNQLTPNNRDKSEILYNCVDTIIKPVNNGVEIKVAVVADIHPDKGQLILAHAINKLSNHHITPVFVGNIIDNDYKLKIQKILPNSIFTGYVNNVIDHIVTFKFVIIPSTTTFETFSLSMVESWVQGIPTIASNLGGPKELVETFLSSYTDKLLFNKCDADDLALKIEHLINDAELYSMVSSEMQNIAIANFSYESFKNKLLNILSSLLK